MLDLAGFAPKETPYKVLHAEAGLRLRQYGAAKGGPALLIVPAPIKKSYIWDLDPEVSVIRLCLERGMRVYLAEWTPIDIDGRQFGLEDYGSKLLGACQQAIEAASGDARIALAGHSLGGILAAIFACLHPQLTRALILLETPLHFGADAGDFAPLVSSVPDVKPIADAFGNVPGSFLNMSSVLAAPRAFLWERLLDACLSMSNPAAFNVHMRVERWACDEFPLPGKLFSEIVELLYRRDLFMQGVLNVGNRCLGPQDLRVPLLNVIDPRSAVIPPQSILPFHAAAASPLKHVLQYSGDIGIGIQHVGVLAGANAHIHLWPAILAWLAKVL